MNRLSNAKSYQVMQHLDPTVYKLEVLLNLKHWYPDELELTVFGMMKDVDGESQTLSTSRESESQDLILMHRPNDGTENIPLFEFEDCTDTEFMYEVTEMVSEMMGIDSDYVDGA